MTIYQHFRKEEHEFIDAVLQWKDEVLNQYAPKLTDFLDPREQQIVESIVGSEGEVMVRFEGGANITERKRAFLYPSYYEPTDEDFCLCLYEIIYPSKFITLEHPQVLGSLMSLGLRRSKFGDILVSHGRAQFVLAGEIASYVEMHLQSVGKAKVSLKPISRADLIYEKEEMLEQSLTVSSLRLDVVLSNVYRISRQNIQPLIEHGLAKVNWKVIEQPSFECKEGDILSLRGYGRSKILSIEGKTKKEKWRLLVGIQK